MSDELMTLVCEWRSMGDRAEKRNEHLEALAYRMCADQLETALDETDLTTKPRTNAEIVEVAGDD